MAGRLEGKVAVVTGAGSGIGEAIVEALHAEGASVVAADISGRQEDVAKRLGERCLAVHADVARAADVSAMCESAVTTFGRLDVLCNNAGIDGEQLPTATNTEENFDHVMAVNAKGVWLGMRYALPIMEANGGGSIINTASVAGLKGFAQLSPYCASKGAVIMMTKSVASEYGRAGIRVNCICPGVTDTPLMRHVSEEVVAAINAVTPLGRVAEVAEMAKTVAFLASDDSSYITGAILAVDGGFTA